MPLILSVYLTIVDVLQGFDVIMTNPRIGSRFEIKGGRWRGALLIDIYLLVPKLRVSDIVFELYEAK